MAAYSAFLLVAIFALAGCANQEAGTPELPIEPARGQQPLPWQPVARERWSGQLVVDPPSLCDPSNPFATEGWKVRRIERPQVIPEGTRELVMNTTATGTWSGFQFGFSIDEGQIQWSQTVGEGNYTLRIPVLPDQFEHDAHRWDFWKRLQLRPNQADCSQGFMFSGDRTIEVFAVPG